MESVGCAQTSHYAATRAIAEGSPTIDRYAEETCDLVRSNGHYYAAKAPAMDLWAAPWYLLLHAAHAVPRNRNQGLGYPAAMLGVPLRALWQIGLWAVVLPALGLLVLMRRTVDRLEPGLGTAAAVTLGLATLVLPFSTLLFAHVPAAALAFLSFSLLFGRDARLLRQRGLLVLTPVVVAGVAGCLLLWRRGLRAEAALIGALCLVEVTWNSGHNGTFMSLGGWVPGPRFLIPLLPFLCFALAPALRRAPATVGAMALISAGAMVVATSAEPLLQSDDTRHWLSRIVHGNFTATVVSLGGVGH